MIDVEPGRLGRRVLREQQRRRRRARALAVLAALGVTGVVTLLAVQPWGDLSRGSDPSAPNPTASQAVASGPQSTMLLVRYAVSDGPAQGVTLLATAEDGQALVLFIPVGTFVEIPGYGLEQLQRAYQFGGAPLVEASVENLLGIDVDDTAAVSNRGLAAFLERTGAAEVTLPERLIQRDVDGSADVRFEPGLQFLDGPRLAELWQFREEGEPELDSFPRQQQVWEVLLAAGADQRVADALVGDGAPQLATDAEPEQVSELFADLIAAAVDGEVTFTVLPVEPFGGGDGLGTYRPHEAGIAQLVSTQLAGSVPAEGGADAVEIQILNGVGTPGVGAAVDRALEGAGFRTVLTDNARSFDYTETLILIYDDSPESLDAARRVQERLGVGTIQVSRQPQSLVDLTIVVGADFDAAGAAPDETEPQEQPS
jgi:anionic cell wall polymer biosynthesis LytR-Cps2A-Psr (LCP) family protein